MSTLLPTIRVFVSSPGDVEEERVIAGRVLKRVADRFAAAAKVEPIFWEHEPLLATDNFQAQIPLPSAAQIFICILWSRLGTPLAVHRPDGSTFRSGTEFEFEDAIAAYRKTGMPDLVVYYKTAEPIWRGRDRAAVRENCRQGDLLDAFIQQWFHGPDGTLKAAFHPFKDSSKFEEHLEIHLKKLIGKRVKQAGGGPSGQITRSRVTWTTGSPYRGLEAFDFEHESIFFGRTAATSAAIRALREQAATNRPFLLILGGSGSGKSSLARAGLLPMLTRQGVVPEVADWRRAVMRPSDANGDLFVSLTTALLRPEALPELVHQGVKVDRSGDLFTKESERILDDIDSVLQNFDGVGKTNLVLVIDQMEEVFTLGSITDVQRRVFFAFIENLVSRGVWVIATLRSDFYHLCAEVPELVRLKAGAGQYDVQPPTPREIAAMILQPATAAGLRFEQNSERNERLQDLLADDAARNPENLPLLSFTLDELYKRRSEQNALRLSVYHQLGRLEGALAHRAGEVFAALPKDVQVALPRVFRQLVTLGSEDDSKAVRTPAPTAASTHDSAATQFLKAFIEARLFSTKRSADGTPIVEITHEALLTRWMPVQKWLAADREHLRVSARVKAAAKLWVESRRASDRLLARGQPLEEAKHLLDAGFELSPAEGALVDASRRRVWRNRQMRQLGVAVLVVLTIVSCTGFILAELNRRESDNNFAHARETVDEFITGNSQDVLSVFPGLQPLRLHLAQQAVAKYETFAANRPYDPEVKAGLGQSRMSLGLIIGQIGSLEKAIPELKQAIELLEHNVAQDPSGKNRLRLAKARNEFGGLYFDVGQPADALPPVERAFHDLDLLVLEKPDDVEVRFELARSLNLRGNCRPLSDEKDRNKIDFERSGELFTGILNTHPKQADCYIGMAAAAHNLAQVYERQKNYPKAIELLDRSARLDEKALNLTPGAPRALSNNALGQAARANMLELMGKPLDADEAYDRAVIAIRDVVKDNPKVSRYQWLLSYTLNQHAQRLSRKKKFLESQNRYEESCRILEGLVNPDDDRPQYAATLVRNRVDFADFYRGSRAGKIDLDECRKCLELAIKNATRLSERFPKASGFNYEFARAYFNLGLLEQEVNRHEAAVEAFRQSIQIYQNKVGVAGSSQNPYYQSEFLRWIDSATPSAEKLSKTHEALEWIAIGEKLGSNCPFAAGKQSLAALLNTRGSIHKKAGYNLLAIEAYKASLAVARPAWEEARWHFYLHTTVAVAYFELATLYQLSGDLAEEVRARQEWLRIWGVHIEDHDTTGLIDPDPPPSEQIARKLRTEMANNKGMKTFAVPCDINGVKYPVSIYIMNVRWPKDPLQDQAKWLEEERGVKIPEDVRNDVRELHRVAHETNGSFGSFQDLCINRFREGGQKRAIQSMEKN